MDARGADDVKRAVGGLVRRAGLRAAQAAHVDQAHRRRARALGQGPDRAHPVVPARAPRHRARHVEVPRAQGLAQPQAHRPVRGDLRLDRVALDHRQPRPRAHRLRPRPAAAVRRRPRAVPRSRRRDRRCSARCTTTIARELGVPAGIPVVGGTPDLQSAAIGSGAVRDFEGHLYVGTSSWLTCHVPFKKTDLFHGIASLPSPLPGQVLRGRRAGGRGREPQLAPRQRDLPRRRAAPDAGPRRLLPAARRRRRDRAAGQQRRDLHALAQRRAHAGRRPPAARRLARPLAADDPRRPRALGARRRRVQQPLAARRASRSSRASRSRRSTSSAAARSRGCGAGSWPTCSTGRSARSSTRSAPTRAARPRSPRSRSAGRRSTTSRAASTSSRRSTPTRDRRGLRRAVPRVPRDPQADQGHLREAARRMAERESRRRRRRADARLGPAAARGARPGRDRVAAPRRRGARLRATSWPRIRASSSSPCSRATRPRTRPTRCASGTCSRASRPATT